MPARLADASLELLFAAQRDGQLVEVNAAWTARLGWSAQELVGGDLHSLWHPDDAERVRALWPDDGAASPAAPFEARIVGRDGAHSSFSWTLQAVDGSVIGSARAAQIAPPQPPARHAIHDALEERLCAAYLGSPVGIALVSKDFRFESVNAALCQMLGYERHELVGRALLDVTHPDDALTDVADEQSLLRGELSVLRRRRRFRSKSGDDVFADLSLSIARGGDGKAFAGIAIVESASGARASDGPATGRERALFAELQTLLESTSEGIYGTDVNGVCTFINAAGAKILGYAPEELVGQSIHALAHSKRPDGTPYPAEECPLERVLRGGPGLRIDEVYFRKDGQPITCELTVWPVLRDGKPAGAVGTLFDVSVKRRAEEALRKTHGILNAVIEGTTDVVTVTDLEGRYLLVNAAGARYFGAEPEEVLGRDSRAFWSDETARSFREHDKVVVEAAEARTFEEVVTRGDQSWTFLSTKGPYRDARGQIAGVIAICRDISDRKRMEATLRMQAEALQLLQTIAIAANEAPSVEEAIRVTLQRIGAYAGWPVGCALMRARPGGALQLAAWHLGQSHLTPAHADELARFATALDLPARAFTQGRPEWVPDLESIADRMGAREARQLGLRGAFALPVTAGGEVLAVLLFLSGQAIEPDAPLIVVLQNAGAQLGLVVQRKRGEETLRASEEKSRLILETATDAFIGLDAEGRILEWNRRAAETFDMARESALGRQLLDSIFPQGLREAEPLRALFTHGQTDVLGTRIELNAARADGRQFPVELTIWAAPAGSAQRYNAFVHDITDRKRAEEALRKANEQLTSWVGELERRNREVSLLNEMGDLLQSCLTADEAHSVVAQFVQQLFPTESGALYILSRPRNALEAMAAWGQETPVEKVLTPEDCWALRRGRMHALGGPAAGPRCRHLGSESHTPSMCVPLMAQGEALGMLFLQEPVIERTAQADHSTDARRRLALTVGEHISLSLANFKLRETLRDQSIRDALTGLYNRRYLEETLDRELRRAERKQRTLGIILVDVDHFKNYNDALGHEAGDALLRALADFFRASVRRDDIVCRFGGEEFTMLLPEASLEIARERAEMLRERVKDLRVEHRGMQLGTVTLSAGIAVYPEHGATLEELFRAADAALYRAKQGGRDRVEMGRLEAAAPPSDPPIVRRIH